MKNKNKVALYIYTATDNEKQLYKQNYHLELYCDGKEYEIVSTYIDLGCKGKDRPSYNKMLEDMKANKFTRIITISVDRISRNSIELNEFIKTIDEYNCAFETVLGNCGGSNTDVKFMRILQSYYAEDDLITN